MFAHKPRSVLLMIALSFLYTVTTAQVNCVPTYLKEYKGTGDMMPYAIRTLGDGSFIVAGKGTPNAASTYEGMVVKLAGDGTVLWSYFIGGPGQDAFTGVTPLSDGGFLLYGTTTSFGYSYEKTWLVRIDNMGAMLWSRQLGNNTTGNDRIKAVQQFSDGDIIGTLNTDDSTAASNAVVFKMALDGTLVWARVFDNGNNDSFLSIAFDGNVIYTGGFYTVKTHRAVLVKMNSADGSLISSINITKKNITFNEELMGLEVYNNIISYGLWMRWSDSFNNFLGGILMAQTDMSDKPRYAVYSDISDTSIMTVKRTSDNGMLFIRPTYNYSGPAYVVKVSQYGANAEWGSLLTNSYSPLTGYGLDITADGGCVSAGFLKPPADPNLMSIIRMNANGITGSCFYGVSRGIHVDTVTYGQQPFTWAIQTGITPAINAITTPTEVPFTTTPNTICNINLCTDVTPLPPACNKTYHLQYSAFRSTNLKDAVTTPDGGKLAIGDQRYDGLVMKINANGDIAWSKQYESFFATTNFVRILRSADGNYIIFGNRYTTYDHYGYEYISMIKVDINGNEIWTRDVNYSAGSEIGDVVEAPDGGFVMLLTGNYGSGSTTSYVIRYDANVNPVWKKEMKHFVFAPVYKSAYCTNSTVLLAYDMYQGIGFQSFGVDKLDLATGDKIYSKTYSVPAPEAIHINRIFAMNDTAYLFLTHSVPTGTLTTRNSPVLLTLKPDGSMIRNILFKGDNIAPGPFYNHWYEMYPPTVTLTPYNDFVLAYSVEAGTDSVLNISRIDKNGNVAWSKNYPGTKSYFPYNIQTQGKGICVMGVYRDNVQQNMYYNNNMFLIKTDSMGQISLGGGSCNQADRPLLPASINISDIPSRIDSIVPFRSYSESPSSITPTDFPIDATLLCNTPANCNIVAAIPKGAGCSMSDTLTYLLDDKADCYAAVTWKFDPAFFKLVNMNGDSIRVVPQKTGVFTINARIEGSCISTTQQITSSIGIAASQVTLGNDAVICTGQQRKLSAGPGYASYKWNDNSTDSTLIATQPGKYYVDVTDNCGGTGTDTLLVTDAGLVFKITGNTTKCNNDTVQLQASGGYYNYQWTPQVNLQATNNTALVSPATTTKYYATAEKWPGCQLTDSILITTLSSPPVNLPNDISICSGDSVIVQAAPGFNTYQWNTGETQSGIIVKSAGTFTIAATYTNGCQSKDTFRLLSLYPLPTPGLDKNVVLCTGSTKTLQPKQLYNSYLWSDGSIGQSMEVNTTGTYWVAVTDGHGCKGSDTARITTIAPAPANFLPADTAICQFAKLTIVPKYTYKSYLWSDFSNSPSLAVKSSGLYWLSVTDQNNCTGSDTISIAGKDCMEGLFVPNAFTPNGDGKNDIFRPLIFGNVTSFTFVIYNRWGGLVYEIHDPATGWNGKINGLSAQKGTYVWFCRYTLEGRPEKTEKGIVELVQ